MIITITPYDDVRWKGLRAHQGAKSGLWYLRDHYGYIRTLASTWLDSVPMIQLVLGNYDLIAAVN
jgi:hypothetical protein